MAVHVGATPPAKPDFTVGPRQQAASNRTRRPAMLALPRRLSLISPSDHANRPPKILPCGRPCWRLAAGKALCHRPGAPTIYRGAHELAVHVGATPPAKPDFTVGPRQQAASNRTRRPAMLALPRRLSLISPSDHANRPPKILPCGRPCWRLAAGKALCHRPGAPTIYRGAHEAAGHVGGAPPAKPDSTVGPRQQAPVSIPVAAPIPCRIHPPFTSSLHLFDSEYYIAGVSF